jgi:hypothetical protein
LSLDVVGRHARTCPDTTSSRVGKGEGNRTLEFVLLPARHLHDLLPDLSLDV